MSLSEIMQSRRSTRGYLAKPVSQDVLLEIFNSARLAPSNSNAQPWHISVVSGDARDRLSAALLSLIDSGAKPNPAFPAGGVGLKGIYKARQLDCAVGYWDVMDVVRGDKLGRMQLLRKNWEFYGAPHAAFLSMPTSMGRANALDLGIILQSVMLLMAERGIGSIAQGALAAFPDPVREFANIPDGNAILCGLSFGYPDPDNVINTVTMPREPLHSVVSFTS